MRSRETPRTDSDKHFDVPKANVCARAATVKQKRRKLGQIVELTLKETRNGFYQTLLLG